MKVKIHKWDDDLALPIPKSLTAALDFREGSTVQVTFQRGRLLIEPATEFDYTLDELLAGVTNDNLRAEIDAGDIEFK